MTRYGIALALVAAAAALSALVAPLHRGSPLLVALGAVALAALVATRWMRGRLEFLRAIARAIDEGVYALDRAGRIVYLNPAAERMLGYAQRELLGKSLKEALRCNRIDGTCSGKNCRLLAVMATGEPFRGADDTLTRKDGSCFPVRYSSAPITRGGETVGAVVAFQDITEERRSAERERFLAAATEQLADSIDYEETLARVARLALPALGDWCMVVLVEETGALRRVAVEALDPARADAAREMLQDYPIDLEADHGVGRVLRTGQAELVPEVAESEFFAPGSSTARTRAQMVHKMGLRSFMGVPLRARGRVLGVMDFAVAGSGRRFGPEDLSLAEQLASRCALAIDNARLHRHAQDAVRAREETLAVVSHDLRNPLAAIRMAARVVAQGAPAPSGEEAARKAALSIDRVCDRMNRLIGDLVDMGAIDAGRLSMVRTAVAPAEAVADAVETMRQVAEQAGVSLGLEPGPDSPHVDGDRDRIQQVLANLVSNAIKVTPPGGSIRLGCEPLGEDVVFSVSDTGPGIAPEQQPLVFDRYWRGENVPYKGTGLGLSIAKAIVEAHGGRLWVVSASGEGAQFRFTIPVARREDARDGEAPSRDGRPLEVPAGP